MNRAPVIAVVFVLCTAAARSADLTGPVEFNRDIRPILSDKCFKCHGPDAGARKAKLRLDLRENALLEHGSGGTPIIPGKPAQSDPALRIEAKDPDDRMPPLDSNLSLNAKEIATLRRW